MKLGVCTLGCKVNTYESEYVINKFKEEGYELVPFDTKADVYLINTCTVTNTSDQKSRKMIREAKKLNKDACVIAMGCYTQKKLDDINLLDYADIIIGNTNKGKVVALTKEFLKSKIKMQMVTDISKANFEDMELSHFNTRTRALLKIEDGCCNYCSYCIIPYVRGNVRSKDPKKVIDEAKYLVSNGYKEIVLVGIHTGHYGADLNNYDFSDLLSELDKIEGLERIRISSVEITELNDKFLEVLKQSRKIVNHIHIPLQSGNDYILKQMNRKYDTSYFYNKIEKIRSIRPGIAITTDVIVGFPGETNELFNKTIEFVRKVNFAGGHVFPYSKRNGTKAASMPNQIEKKDKHERCKYLINVFNELEHNYYNNYVGKEVMVIPESYDNGVLTGHSDNYLKISFNGCKELLGNLILVKINKYENNILFGTSNLN